MKLVAGADGCKAGWIRLARALDSTDVAIEVFADAKSLIFAEPEPVVLAVDAPIGLTESGPRECDRMARRILRPPRASSVFPAPIRPALAARTQREASEISRRLDGRGVPVQAWGIYARIRELDVLLRGQPELQGRVREVHPELCFWAWNAERPMEFSKKTPTGRAERSELVDGYFGTGAASRLLDSRPPGVAADDVLDACAALWTAERMARAEARTLPPDPPSDAHGLRMEMVY